MSKSILLVDDAAFMRMMLRDITQKHDYQVIGEAENGIEGVEKYKSLDPDIVVLDIIMPEMNGIDALKMIKEYNNGAKAVMCSAMGTPVVVIDALLAGASNFVVKPFQAHTLIEAVNDAFIEEKVFDIGVLEKLRENLADSMDILSQCEIDDIINCALICTTSDSKVEEIISKYANNSKTRNKENYNGAEAFMRSAMEPSVTVLDSLFVDGSNFIAKSFQSHTPEAVNNAFIEEKVFDIGVLEKLRENLTDRMYILSQCEIDDIINCVATCTISDPKVEEIISKYANNSKKMNNDVTLHKENYGTIQVNSISVVYVQEEIKEPIDFSEQCHVHVPIK